MLDESTIELLRSFLPAKTLDVTTTWMFELDVYAFSFAVKVDQENDKEVLAVRDVQISLHKEQQPDDTASGDDIGLSSEDEADEMSGDEYIGRKYPVQPQPQSDPQPTPQSGVSTGGMASVQVPISMLQQVHTALG